MLKNILGKTVFVVMLFILSGSSTAQYYFGRNKIQYNSFKWQILKTEHFDIYYYPEMESLAEIGAYFAEESYTFLQDKMNITILRRIPLIFYSSHFHFEETNTVPNLIPEGVGGFFEFMKGRVVVPNNGSLSKFKNTIRHELVHVFQKSYTNQVLKSHKCSLEGGPPLWFVEGLAEYWSERWSPEAEMVIRDCVLNNSMVPLNRMGAIWGTYLMYKEGQSVLTYISKKYGEEQILALMDNVWKYKDFSRVMKATIGKDYKSLSEEWLYSLKKHFYPLIEDHDFPRMAASRITNRGYNSLPAFYRYNGVPKVIFVANRNGYSSIYQKKLNSSEQNNPEVLVQGEKSANLESFHILSSKVDISRNNNLAFIAKSGPRDRLYIMDLATREIIRKLDFKNLVSIFSPSWSPDGEAVVFSALNQAGMSDIYKADIETGSLKRLTSDFYTDSDPDWSPDGNYIVFSSDRTYLGYNGYKNIFLYEIKTGIVRYLTYGRVHDASPVWSPDGNYIAFASDRKGASNIWIIEKADLKKSILGNNYSPFVKNDGGIAKVKQVTNFSAGCFYPSWTDSLDIIFTTYERGSFQLREIAFGKKKLNRIKSVKIESPEYNSKPWKINRISGKKRINRFAYRKKFNLDFAQSMIIQDPIFGTSGGAQLAVSDMLGDEKYYFLLYNNARTQSDLWKGFNFAVTRLDMSRRINYSLGFYRLAGYYYNPYDDFYYENRYGVNGAVIYPLNKFERIELSMNIRHSDKDWYTGEGTRKALLVSNFISYTKDNSLWGSTGPIDGARYKITLGNTVDVRYSNVNFTTLIFDLRKYFRIAYRMCHAVRVLGEFNRGKEPLPFFLGGSWSMRGYRLWSLAAPNVAFISNEFRFPFIDTFYLRFPFGGIGFSSIQGALFVDAGNSWEGKLQGIKGSFGAGIRLRLGGYVVLRYDIGRRTDFHSIEKKTFTQFFFGWDF
ncbi:PD40 domain-containing protein [bacterium]|nr:PD40 domain-containing protein [bacterium]